VTDGQCVDRRHVCLSDSYAVAYATGE